MTDRDEAERIEAVLHATGTLEPHQAQATARALAAAGFTVTKNALPIHERHYLLDAEYHAAVYMVKAMNRRIEGDTDG